MGSISNEKIALIHVAKKQIAMVDDDYRAMLQRVAGVSSSTDLDDAGLDRVMAEFERLGFQKPRSRVKGAKRAGMASAAQLGHIRALWKAYSGKYDDHKLGLWLEKKMRVSDLRFLEAWRAGKAIAVLEKLATWRKTHPFEPEAPGDQQ